LDWLNLILTAAGGATIALGAAGWLLRTQIEHRLSGALETHKAQLAQKSDVLKTEMSIYAHEQNVGLSRIDAQRSDAILAIWGVLCKWDDVFVNITAPNKSIDFQNVPWALDKYREWAKSLMRISDTLSVEVRNRAILVDQATYEVIVRCGKAIADVSTGFWAASFEGVNLSEESDLPTLFAKVQRARHDLHSATATNIKDFRNALVYEFRVLMRTEKLTSTSLQATLHD